MPNNTKNCRVCGLTSQMTHDNWYKDINSKDGFSSACKKCMYMELQKKSLRNKSVNVEKLSLGTLEDCNKAKICSKCKINQPLTFEFWNKAINTKDGFTSRCKKCDKVRFKNYYNKELSNIRQRHKAEPSYVFSHVKDMAKKRNLIFNIDLEYYIKNLFMKDCHYCGGKTKGWLDRVNNDKEIGYIIDNVVSCCENCNRAKGTLSSHEFIQHILKILKHNNLI